MVAHLGTNKVVQCLCGLLQRINYAKSDSDVIAKVKGTFTERPKRTKEEKKKKKIKDGKVLHAVLIMGLSFSSLFVEQFFANCSLILFCCNAKIFLK